MRDLKEPSSENTCVDVCYDVGSKEHERRTEQYFPFNMYTLVNINDFQLGNLQLSQNFQNKSLENTTRNRLYYIHDAY